METITISTVGDVCIYTMDNCEGLKHDISNVAKENNVQMWLSDPMKYENEIDALREEVKIILMKHLPQSLVTVLGSFPDISGEKILIVKQLPFERPEEYNLVEIFLLGISNLMPAKPFSYKDSYRDRFLHHVKPDPSSEYTKTAYSSRGELGLHVENSYDSNRPDSLALYCITGDQHALTTFYSLTKLYENLDPELKNRLDTIGRKNEFLFIVPTSHADRSGCSRNAVIFDQANGQVGIRYSEDYVQPQTPEAEQLKNDLTTFFKSDIGCPSGYCLGTGDLIIWHNHSMLHGRTAFAPNYQPNAGRFLIRMFLSHNLELPYQRA